MPDAPLRVKHLKPDEKACFFAPLGCWIVVHPDREPLLIHDDNREEVMKPNLRPALRLVSIR